MRPTVLIVDDDPSIGLMWTTWFAMAFPKIAVVHATDLTCARASLAGAAAVALFLDIRLAGEDGLDLLRELRAANDQTPVLVVTGDVSLHRVAEARALAAEIAFKPVIHEDLLPFLKRAIAHPRTQRASVALVAQQGRLNARQTQVLGLVAKLASNRAIADALRITVGRVKTIVQQILDKLGFDSRLQVVQFLYERSCGAGLELTPT